MSQMNDERRALLDMVETVVQQALQRERVRLARAVKGLCEERGRSLLGVEIEKAILGPKD